ncbi:hypothetical protein SO802_027729 [Lithocarpus litseifolius]|uniref:Uncharacterized protein n=1 Tax=Lithocarpus litseifolius TaxID=425828 RepID=A0AAW2C6I1_9ROSI
MPFPMKIQPIDIDAEEPVRTDTVKPAVLKSRLKRLFDRQFPSVLRISSAEKPSGGGETHGGGGVAELEPSSVCLAKMVQSFIEDNSETKQQSIATSKYGRNRCNCFNGNSNDSSDDEFDDFAASNFGGDSSAGTGTGSDVFDTLKSLSPCASVAERNLLADAAKIVDKNNKINKSKDDLRKIVTDGLSSLGYDSSICKSKWDKSPSYPAGEYEYIDVIVEGERLLMDIDFRSEFEIARSTGTYKAILQSLPYIYVGKADRLGQIASIVSEAAKQSLKKKGMHFPPWRKADYMRAKWLSPYTRRTTTIQPQTTHTISDSDTDSDCGCGDLHLIFGDKTTTTATATATATTTTTTTTTPSHSHSRSSDFSNFSNERKLNDVLLTWKPPAVKPKSLDRSGPNAKLVTGLASLLKDHKP